MFIAYILIETFLRRTRQAYELAFNGCVYFMSVFSLNYRQPVAVTSLETICVSSLPFNLYRKIIN